MHESEKWKWSRVWLFATPWTAALQAPLSMGFSGREYWSGVPLPSPTWTFQRFCLNSFCNFPSCFSKIQMPYLIFPILTHSGPCLPLSCNLPVAGSFLCSELTCSVFYPIPETFSGHPRRETTHPATHCHHRSIFLSLTERLENLLLFLFLCFKAHFIFYSINSHQSRYPVSWFTAASWHLNSRNLVNICKIVEFKLNREGWVEVRQHQGGAVPPAGKLVFSKGQRQEDT